MGLDPRLGRNRLDRRAQSVKRGRRRFPAKVHINQRGHREAQSFGILAEPFFHRFGDFCILDLLYLGDLRSCGQHLFDALHLLRAPFGVGIQYLDCYPPRNRMAD